MTKLLKAALLCAALPMMAQTVGVGLSLKENENTIFVPIQLKASLLLEPYVAHWRISGSQEGSPSGGTYRLAERSLVLGMGAFWRRAQGERGQSYLGGRVGYIRSTYTSDSGPNHSEHRAHGVEFVPTLGYSYALTPHLLLGGEVGYRYQRITQEDQDSFSNRTMSGRFSMDGTVTALVVRYLF